MAARTVERTADRRSERSRTISATTISDVDVVVVGAGMAGLAAVDHLRSAGLRVLVLEAADAPGGLARAIQIGGEPVEAYYHHVFPQDDETIALCARLGLLDDLEWRLARMGVLGETSVVPLDTPVDLLRFQLLPIRDRLRVGLAMFWQLIRRDSDALDSRPAQQEVRRWFGQRAYEVLWHPLLDAKFGASAVDKIPMAWLVARIRQRAGARRAVGDRLGYLRGSLGRLITALVADLSARGVEIRTSTRVTRIERRSSGWAIHAERDGSRQLVLARAVVAATAAPILSRLIDLPADYRSRVASIDHRGVVCVLLELDRPLSDVYWTSVVGASRLGCVGIIEHTNFVPAERYGGRTIVYLAHYVDRDGSTWIADSDTLVDAAEPILRRLNPGFERSWILDAHVSRDPFAQPVPVVGGPMPGLPVETGLPGLFHASLAHIYPDDRGVSQALRLGKRVAGEVISHVGVTVSRAQ